MEETKRCYVENGKAINLWHVAEVELIYRNKQLPKDRPVVNTSSAAYEVLSSMWDMNRIELVEEFKILLLNRHRRCLGISNIAIGGSSACAVDPKIIFSTALKANASSIILAHNHPSGELKPSAADKQLTEQFKEAGKYLQITVCDHLILSSSNYYSMTDEGLLY